jgi:hypothetical protein
LKVNLFMPMVNIRAAVRQVSVLFKKFTGVLKNGNIKYCILQR